MLPLVRLNSSSEEHYNIIIFEFVAAAEMIRNDKIAEILEHRQAEDRKKLTEVFFSSCKVNK